jgi:hypothetical protein
MLEILRLFNFDSELDEIKTFHICESPGQMMDACKYYVTKILNKKHTWTAQNIIETAIYDKFGLIEQHANQWNYGVKQKGDITNIHNIMYYRDKYKHTDIQWVSGDCGIKVCEKNKSLKMHFAEILTTMLILSDGGHYVSKVYFPIVDKGLINLLYILFNQFDEFYFYKSYQRPDCIEVNLIGKGYKYNKALTERLIDIYKSGVLTGLDKCSQQFEIQILNFSKQLYTLVASSIERNLYYYDHIHDIPGDLLKKLINDRHIEWDNKFMGDLR